MKENDKKYLLRTFDDIIELMATKGQKIVCGRLQEIRKLLKEKDAEIENLKGIIKEADYTLEIVKDKLNDLLKKMEGR